MKKALIACLCLLALTGWYSCMDNGASKPATRFILTENMDSAVRPGDNFYLFVNGRWQKNAVIPQTESSVGAFLDVYNHTKDNIKSILEETSKGTQAPGSIEQKVGDLYASGMDSETVEKLGYDPVKPYLQQIKAFKDVPSILDFESAMQRESHSYLIGLAVFADLKNSKVNIANLFQTGLGLPDRDYYFRTDPASQAVQKAYQAYIRKIFMLIGDDSATAVKKSTAIYGLELEMASVHRTNVELRDPQSNYHKVAVSDMDKKMPLVGWKKFLHAISVDQDSIDLGQPAYYEKLNTMLTTRPVEFWQIYYTFHVLDDYAYNLSSPFVNAKFDYAGKALSGQEKIKPRWERMYRVVDNSLGEALGQLYVKKYFTEEAKKRMLELVNNLQTAFAARIDRLDWMSDSTKKVAKDKLFAFLKKIGYPDKWRDYSKVTISKDTYFNNLVSCNKNEFQYQISKVGKPVDRTEWGMTPPTVNAYYNPTFNEIVFPAGILQFPYFDLDADDAINYGAIGMFIGHEMTHGFDDQGAQFDKDGNLKNWWSRPDSLKFVAKSKLVIALYNSFTVLDTLHVNGALTNGENMADIGGLNIAYDAFKMTKEGQDTSRIEGFTPDERFFISFAQGWREKDKDEAIRQQINTDPHSPSVWRVIGPLMNCPPFYKAFNLQPGDKMYKTDSAMIKIW
jgi:putative endopeptidase